MKTLTHILYERDIIPPPQFGSDDVFYTLTVEQLQATFDAYIAQSSEAIGEVINHYHPDPDFTGGNELSINEEVLQKLPAGTKLFTSPQPSQDAVPDGSWLWCKLMDYCRNRRISPAKENDLFSIAGEAHIKYANQSAYIKRLEDALNTVEDYLELDAPNSTILSVVKNVIASKGAA